MKRDSHISKLIREGGIEPAPEGFTSGVMDRLQPEPGKLAYKPLIGRGGRILIILGVAVVVILSILYGGESGQPGFLGSFGINNRPELPQWNLNLGFLSEIKISKGVVAGIVALFVLVLSDAGLNRRKYVF